MMELERTEQHTVTLTLVMAPHEADELRDILIEGRKYYGDTTTGNKLATQIIDGIGRIY
jgi:hypothetical protein